MLVTGKAKPRGLPSYVVSPPEFPQLTSVDDVGTATLVHDARCRDTCAFDATTEWHHRRLITIEADPDVLLELIELAVTWPELEYSETRTIAPEHWMSFLESHHWSDPDRVERFFSPATDIVMTATRASRRRRQASDCHFGHVDASQLAISVVPEEQSPRCAQSPVSSPAPRS